jgi:hypothetical protein
MSNLCHLSKNNFPKALEYGKNPVYYKSKKSSGGIKMKKIIYSSFVILSVFAVFMLTNIHAPANEKSDDVIAYETMVKAEKENRDLTADEVKQVEKETKKLIAFDTKMGEKEKNVNRAVSAMYMNFYETQLDGIQPHYDQAKELYESYMNE